VKHTLVELVGYSLQPRAPFGHGGALEDDYNGTGEQDH